MRDWLVGEQAWTRRFEYRPGQAQNYSRWLENGPGPYGWDKGQGQMAGGQRNSMKDIPPKRPLCFLYKKMLDNKYINFCIGIYYRFKSLAISTYFEGIVS
jgi:hypothetical protein